MNSISSPPAIEPDLSHIDTAEDILRDATKWGLVEDIRALLSIGSVSNRDDQLKIACDLVYELAASSNRDLAVDLLIHVAGIAEFEPLSVYDYSRKHGCTCEWFRREAEAMRKRLERPLHGFHSSARSRRHGHLVPQNSAS